MPYKTTKIWFSLSLAFLLFAGCGDDDDVTRPADYMTELDIPLAVGNQWTFLDVTEVGTFVADTSYVTSIITDIREFGGLTYYCMVDSAHTGEVDLEPMYLRQHGGIIDVYPALPPEPPEDPVEAWVYQILTESAPWKMADANVAPGVSWTEYDTANVFPYGELQVEIEVQMTVERLEDMAVTVPAGSWTAYRGAIHQSTTVTIGGEQNGSVADQVLYLVDDVGVAKQDVQVSSDFPGEPTSIEETAVLLEYSIR